MPLEPAFTDRDGQEERVREVGRRVAVLAGRQHGVIAHRQLARLEVSDRQIYRWVRSGRLHRIYRGVFAVGHGRLTQQGRWIAGTLAGGNGSALSHLSGAGNWELTDSFPSRTEITTPTTRHRRSGLRIHVASLASDEVTIRNGIPTTTVARTVLDVCATTDPYRAERIIARAEFRKLLSHESVAQAIDRYRGHRGVGVLRRIHGARLPSLGVTESVLEERFLRFLDRHHLPRPRLNVPLTVGGAPIRVDCLWHEQRLIVELDGRAAHIRAAAFESDRLRDRRLTVAGWRPMRVTWRHLEAELELARDLRTVLSGDLAVTDRYGR